MNREHPVQRIVLPSGNSIEVVRLEGRSEAPPEQRLHICRGCGSELVQPVAWREREDDRWELTLHCPNCAWSCRGIYTEKQIIGLEEQMELGVESIMRDLRRLTSANMADEVERFASSLEANLILPEDF